MVFDSRAKDSLVIVGADLFLTVIGNTLPKESGDIVRSYRKNRRSDDLVIKWLQPFRLFEHDVRCTLDLLDCPCVAESKRFRDWTAAFCESIQDLMEVFRIDPVRESLGGFDIRNLQERVIMHAVSDFLLLQFMGEQVMAVHIELQTERRPGRDTEVTEPKLFVNEVEIIVETFALVKLKECLPRGLVMPWLISTALFHGRKDMDQPLGLSGLLDDFLDPVILAESPELADELDFNAVFICDALGICTDLFCKGLGEI